MDAFLPQLAGVAVAFLTEVSSDAIVSSLRANPIVEKFCTSERAEKTPQHHFFALFQFASESNKNEYSVGIVDDIAKIPKSATSCISLSRTVPSKGSVSISSLENNNLNTNDNTNGGESGDANAPLPPVSLKNVSLQTVSLSSPLSELNNALLGIYEPLCRNNGHNNVVMSRINELIGSISSHASLMVDFKLNRYVHPELLTLCEQNPTATAKQIADEMLGARANDNGFINAVIARRAECVNVFDIDIEAKEVTTIVDEVRYWRDLDTWTEDIRNQLQSREWQLVQRVVQRRGADTTVEQTFSNKRTTVNDFHRFLSSVPFQEIPIADMNRFGETVRRVFESLSRQKKFPHARLMKVADAVIETIAERLFELAKEKAPLLRRESMQLLEQMGSVINEAQNGYTSLNDQRDSRFVASRSEQQKTVALVTGRIKLLRDLINSHFSLLDALRTVFVSDHQEFAATLIEQGEKFEAAANLHWELTGPKEALFTAMMAGYNKELSNVDDAIARLVRNKLDAAATAEDMYRIHEQFRAIRREKVRFVISNKRDELTKLINVSIDSIKARYFDENVGNRAIRVSVAQGYSKTLATILWYRSIDHALSEQLTKLDAVSELGWQQLVSLQTIDSQWVLNEQLATFMGVKLSDVASYARFDTTSPEILGTSLALAYLEKLYKEEHAEWSRNIGVTKARNTLDKKSPNAFKNAEAFLNDKDVGALQKATRDKSRDYREFKKNISAAIARQVQDWCKQVRATMSKVPCNTKTRLLSGVIFGMRGNTVVVDFPFELSAWILDYGYLSSNRLILASDKNVDDVRNFIEGNSGYVTTAVAISQLLEAFYQKRDQDEDGLLGELLAVNYNEVHMKLIEGARLSWGRSIDKYTDSLGTLMNDFCNLVDDIRGITSQIEDALITMEHDTCDPIKIAQHLIDVKRHVNELNIKAPNARSYLARIQPRVDEILAAHLQDIVATWLEEYESLSTNPIYLSKMEASTPHFKLQPLRIALRVTRDDVRLDSLPTEWRAFWYNKFNEALEWLNTIPHFETDAANAGATREKNYSNTYARLIGKLVPGTLSRVYAAIEATVSSAVVCEERWRANQQFYNLDISASTEILGNDLLKWHTALTEIHRDSVEQMNSTQPLLLFGGIIIDARSAQDALASRFDGLQQALDKKFRDVVSAHFSESFTTMRSSRDVVENRNVGGDLNEAIAFLAELSAVQERIAAVKEQLPLYQTVEKGLRSKSTFQQGSNWISVERINTETSSLCEVLERKKSSIDSRRPEIEAFVHDRVAILDDRIQRLEKSYREANLTDGQVGAAEALAQINTFYESATEADTQLKEVQVAQRALGEEPMQSSKLESILSDIRGQRQAYGSVKELYDEIDKLKRTRFTEVQARNLQQSLAGLQEKMLNFNPAVRHFAVYGVLDAYLKELVSNNRFIQDLRSDAILDRHWIALKSQLKRSKWIITELTLGDIWDSKPVVHSKVYLSVIENAQGQHRLQMQIDHVAQFWNNHPLEVTFFQNRVTLIKGWDVLFEKLGEDLNSLAAMKLSPHYGDSIAATANDWDDKLNRARQILEMLVDVQRKWVYLDGIFSGSVEIRHQLPSEASQFDKTSKEFIALMPKAKGESITVLKLIAVDKILQTLEKIGRELNMIQKTLGEYLETQRSRFPRFYFVGDEDLLEVIGNGKDPLLVAKHLKKMFCGISSLTIEPTKDKAGLLKAMISPETEVVEFSKPFDTAGLAVYEWLTQLEQTMVATLRSSVGACVDNIPKPGTSFQDWIKASPAQIIALSIQVQWVRMMEAQLSANKDTSAVEQYMSEMLNQLAGDVLTPGLDTISRHKSEQVVTVAVYQRDAARKLAARGVKDVKHFDWLSTMRPYHNGNDNTETSLLCKMADASFQYSFEYLGLAERLVQTSLTDQCFLTLTQALHTRLGGSPAGPAGTGKTETVKALGNQLGRFVLVFCCDETFDFKSMGRIFVGLCQVGAWGCFDEFNRLEERILSAVSQQIQTIQEGLKSGSDEVILSDRRVAVHHNMGMFITMNPGYAGRSNLPDNLKQLFRAVAMTTPDRENIAEVMLFAQGFKTAETLSRKIVPLFRLCRDQLSQQSHYDFGLRALKSVLISAGGLKRAAARRGDGNLSEEDEIRLMMQSLTETIVPKLIADDVDLFCALLGDVFPGCTPKEIPLEDLKKAINEVAAASGFTASDLWLSKIIQLYKILHVNHGIMLVGSSGCGKTTAWTTLLKALAKVEDVDGHAYIIDPKALTKGELYGVLDPTTREWKDGVFTATLRRIVDNVKGDDQTKKRHWIFFDGDVDPEWVENLNSLLDDNKLLTLPNGERLTLPPNVRIMFEVQDLRYATPATVSRCGMVWFSQDTVTPRHILDHAVRDFRTRPYLGKDEPPITFAERISTAEARKDKMQNEGKGEGKELTPEEVVSVKIQNKVMDVAEEYFRAGGVIEQTLEKLEKNYTQYGIMDFNRAQSLRAFFTLFANSAYLIRQHTEQTDKELSPERFKLFVGRKVMQSLLWGFASEFQTVRREEFAAELKADIPSGSLLDYEAKVEDGEWSEIRQRVVKTEIPAQKVGTNDIVIPTVDTARHEDVISAWIRTGKPVILCGPPGSGKTMSLTAVLRASTQYEAAFLNFSSGTAPDTITKIFDQYCQVKNTKDGLVLTPTSGKKLIVFCDEINLPSADKYGTQRVVQFLRQLTERRGYYRAKDNAWISLHNIQFVGACNPPTDPGRVPLTHRFLRWAPVLFVDFPSHESLISIYETYCRALLMKNVKLRPVSSNLAKAMVDVYKQSQSHFTPEMQRHYVYSPRELSRWSRAIFEGISSLDEGQQKNLTPEELVRLAVHEGLRLFRDRLTNEEEEIWTDETMDRCFSESFPTISRQCLERPILYSTVLTRAYTSATREQLRTHIREKLKAFADEEMDVELVVFDAVVDHVVRIDRVLRQPLGHMLLVGSSGVGKTVLSRFVAWMNNLSVFQIKVHRNYTIADFEEDLRAIMKRCGAKREKICFIFDESNIMDSNFLEYMNALLASGEVPGLFDGEEWPKLMHEIRDGVNAAGASGYVDLSSEPDMYKWFVTNVQLYLHVVFTMNPHSPDFHNRSATSPALFNRCTIDWFGDWSTDTIFQVARELTAKVDVLQAFAGRQTDADIAHEVVARCMCRIHTNLNSINETVRAASAGRGTFITPRHFLDFIQQFHSLYKEKRGAVEELQRHLNTGLSKLRETSESVDRQQKSLNEKEKVLAESGRKAQEMLEMIIKETEKAKKGKEEATILKGQLEIESKRLNEDRSKVEGELSLAEPALKEAEAALATIKPEYLREIRSYTIAPPAVKKVLEAVCTVLGEKRASDWAVVKEHIRRDDFINQVKAFKPENITDEARDRIKKAYISDESFTYEFAMRASKAAGPLQKWVVAQIRYSEIFANVGPMREQILKLSAEYDRKLEGLTKAEADIEANEQSINKLKEDYQVTTAETTQIKQEITSVAARCDRAKALVEKLLAEKIRWEEQSANFRAQSASVLGDCVISAAFLAYIGYFDEMNRRKTIMPEWQGIVEDSQIDFRKDLSVIEYLSLPEDRLAWAANKLPQDSLCVENAIIMQRHNRYPLIIDPSGQAVDFLLNHMKAKKIVKTSFVEKGFMKQLEMAVRFGYPILVQDVEFIDPVLNPLLNKEVRRTGGRHLVRLGAQDIDISPTFALYMSTRDSTFQFAPDICGRSTITNFTVTLSSLQSQCMHTVMRRERPDIDEKRSDLMKLQGEFRLKLRMLEKQLLTAISDSEGNILENDSLIKTLETLKSESAEIEKKMGQSEIAYQEIVDVENKYTPMAAAASKLYFSLGSLEELNSIYRFSLRFFFDIVDASMASLPEGLDADARIPVIIRAIFTITHCRVTRSLFQADHTAFEMRLAQLRNTIPDAIGKQIRSPDWDLLLTSSSSANASKDAIDNLPNAIPRTLPHTVLSHLVTLMNNSSFISLKQSMANKANEGAWKGFFSATNPLESIPDDAFDSDISPARRAFLVALLCKVTRRDAFNSAAEAFLRVFFDTDHNGEHIVERYGQKNFFVTQAGFSVEDTLQELGPNIPLLLVSAAGYDASGRVEDLARQTGMSLQAVAMGSPEGYEEANSFVSQGMRLGTWVLLKNVHLASQFLTTLEKRIHSEQLEGRIHKNFRLFLSSEPSDKIPASLVMASIMMVFEPPPGIKSNMLRTLGSIKESQVPQYPKELPRLYFIAAWLHSVVMERMNYLPLGWSKRYEFSEADFRRVIGTIDSWVGIIRGERHHVPPAELPWDAIRQLVAETVYGGRIDNAFDQALLRSFCDSFFRAEAFDPRFNFVSSTASPICCDGISLEDFQKWVKDLPAVQSPEWLGLPATATEMVLIQRADATLSRLTKIQNLFVDEGGDKAEEGGAPSSKDGGRAGHSAAGGAGSGEGSGNSARWAQKLLKSLAGYQEIVSKIKFTAPKSTSTTPISLTLRREGAVATKLLAKVTNDLNELVDVCKGTLRPSNYHRSLIDAFSKELVPASWKMYVTPSLGLRSWLVDFRNRLARLHDLLAVKEGEIHLHRIFMGSLLSPEAFLTATRQAAARQNNFALEQLEMQVTLYASEANLPPAALTDITVVGITLHSAAMSDNGTIAPITDDRTARTAVPVARLSWTLKKNTPKDASSAPTIDLPLYLSDERAVALGVVPEPVDPSVPAHAWYQLGVCLTAWEAEEK